MKQLLILIFFLFSITTFSQNIVNRTNGTVTVNDPNLFTSVSFRVPVFNDTTAANLVTSLDSAGKLIYTRVEECLWIRGSFPKRWLKITPGSGTDSSAFRTNTQLNDTTYIICDLAGRCDTIVLIGTDLAAPDTAFNLQRVTAIGNVTNLPITVSNGIKIWNGNQGLEGYIAIGKGAMENSSSSGGGTAVGFEALKNVGASAGHVAVGYQSLLNHLTGSNNTAVGLYSMINSTTSNSNTAIGAYSMRGAAGLFTGTRNSGLGMGALDLLTSGYDNAAFGYWTMLNTSSGYENTAFGTTAMRYNTTGYQNVALGRYNLWSNVSGYGNVSAGFRAGYYSLGDLNVYLGNQAGENETGSNKLYIANSSTANPLIYGEFNNNLLKFNANTHPAFTSTYALGDRALRWRNAYMDTLNLTGNVVIETTDNANVSLLETRVAGVVYPWFQIKGTSTGSQIIMGANNSGSGDDMIRLTANYTCELWTGLYRGLNVDVYDFLTLRGNRGGIDPKPIRFMVGADTTAYFGSDSYLNISKLRYTKTTPTVGQVLTATNVDGTVDWQTPSGTTETASNGLTKTINDIKLGGTLTENTTINGMFSYGVTITNNTGIGNNTLFVNQNGAGVGLQALAVSGNAIYAQTSSGIPIAATKAGSPDNNSVQTIAVLTRSVNSGLVAAGAGSALEFHTGTTAGEVLANKLASKWTNPSHAVRTSEFFITGFNNGTEYTLLQLSGAGLLQLTQGAPEHADNAAAVTAGLPVGTIYRTGDNLKIVH